jgi:hypothetical protein
MIDTSQVYDGEFTWAEYYAQFETAKPELGKTYVVQKGSWAQSFYKIVFMNDQVALGVRENPFDKTIIEYCLFNGSGLNVGWKYQDPRPEYRLQEI